MRICVNSQVDEILIENNKTIGVRLASGEVLRSRTVLTNCTDHVTFNQLIGKNVPLGEEFVKVIKILYKI